MPNITKSLRTAKRPAPLTMCPCGPEGLVFATHWYRLPGVEGFFICTKCFEDKLSHTQFAGLFDCFHNEPLPGTKSICDFNSERVSQILSQTIRTSNTEQLFTFAEHRSQIPTCDGLEGTHGSHQIQWFSNPELPDFVACEACYEDFILATSFASCFTPHPEIQPMNEVWICDLAIPYIRRNLIESAKSTDWYNFVNAVHYRSSIPTCESKLVTLSTRKWFRPIRPWLISNLTICEACYLDHAGFSATALNFMRVHPKFSELKDQVLCSFQIKPIRAYNEQLLNANFGRWHNLVSQIVSKPLCTKGDIEAEWYTLPDPQNSSRNIANFDVCGACYLGYVEATGHASAFRKVTYPSGTTRVCDFSPITLRFPKFMQKWSQMVFTGDSSPLAEYAARITKMPACMGSKEATKARWWGMDEFLFCAECYEEVGKSSYFAQLFNYQAASFPEARCDMYTDNMRRRYLEACRERSLDDFINYCRGRQEIWQLVQQETKRHKMLLKMNQRAYSQGLLVTTLSQQSHHSQQSHDIQPSLSNAIVPVRPSLAKARRVSAPAKFDPDHRMTEENLKRAQRKAVRESMQKSPTLIHLQLRWREVE